MSVMAPLESTSSTPYTKSAASFGLSSVTDAFAFLHRHHRSWAEQSFRPEDLIIWHGKYKEIRKRLDYNYHAAYNEARISFQDALVDSMLAESTREVRTNCSQPAPWIVFTAGAMGAGKSRTVKLLHQKGRFPLQSFTVVDPDRIRRYLPEFEMLIKLNPEQAGELTRKEAGLIAEVLVQVALDRGHNVLVDGSLRDALWYQNYFLQLRNDRPDLRIAILHVTAPRDSVFERASVRKDVIEYVSMFSLWWCVMLHELTDDFWSPVEGQYDGTSSSPRTSGVEHGASPKVGRNTTIGGGLCGRSPQRRRRRC